VTRQSAAVGAALRDHAATVAKALVLEVDRELRTSGTGTPVDTGHARRNWVPSVAVPFQGEAASDGPHDAGVAAVFRFKLGDGALFVSNNVPYIKRLNLGWSAQAPVGFIEACVDRADATIKARYVDVSIDVTTRGAGSFSDLAGGAAAGGIADAYSPFGSGDDE
jgi:hypothetical protein